MSLSVIIALIFLQLMIWYLVTQYIYYVEIHCVSTGLDKHNEFTTDSVNVIRFFAFFWPLSAMITTGFLIASLAKKQGISYSTENKVNKLNAKMAKYK